MTAPAQGAPEDIPLPFFARPAPESVRHPVLAALLAEVEERAAAPEAPVAYYSDAADPVWGTSGEQA